MPSETQTLEAMPALPDVKGGVSPYLTCNGAGKASDFYQQAFGATEALRMPPDPKGRYMHIHLYINGSSVMLSDAFEEHGHPWVQPAGFTLCLEVDDADAWQARAVKAGCTEIQPVQDMFWGARYGQVKDPFGFDWAFNQPKT